MCKQLNEGFKRSVYWNEYKSKIETKEADAYNLKRFFLDDSFQGFIRLFVLAFDNNKVEETLSKLCFDNNNVERDNHRNYFLLRVDITNYNVLIDGGDIYDQQINDQIKNYDEIRKIGKGKGDDYTTGCPANISTSDQRCFHVVDQR